MFPTFPKAKAGAQKKYGWRKSYAFYDQWFWWSVQRGTGNSGSAGGRTGQRRAPEVCGAGSFSGDRKVARLLQRPVQPEGRRPGLCERQAGRGSRHRDQRELQFQDSAVRISEGHFPGKYPGARQILHVRFPFYHLRLHCSPRRSGNELVPGTRRGRRGICQRKRRFLLLSGAFRRNESHQCHCGAGTRLLHGEPRPLSLSGWDKGVCSRGRDKSIRR